MRTANLAIVFTDIKGFTERTSQQTLEENERLLKTHNELLAPLFRAFNGRIVKTIGDAFMVTFESPTGAVMAGVAIQDALWRHNRDAAEGDRLDVRVAVNVGEVRLEGTDVFGEPVNIAARVEGLAESGEVTFTEAVYLSMNRAEVAAEEIGRFDLKGIPEPVRLFRASKVTSSADSAPYGNKGLTRAEEAMRGTYSTQKAIEAASNAASVASEVASRAMVSTTKLVQDGLANAEKRGIPRQRVAIILAASVVVLLIILLAITGNEYDRAIAEAKSAAGAERSKKIEAARKLINQNKEAKDRSWYLGELYRAVGESTAVSHYVAASRAGVSKAEDRLIDLLENPKCSMRAQAAEALANLKVKRARGALEDLAKGGGPGDGEQVLVFGCDSRKAANVALSRLKD